MLRGPIVSEMCGFHLLILDLKFIKKSLIEKKKFLLRNIWFLKLGSFVILISNFKTLEPKNFLLEIWNLKSGILSLRILKIKAWNFDHEIWSLNFLKTTNLRVWNWKFRNENFDFERYLKTLKKNIFILFFGLTEST